MPNKLLLRRLPPVFLLLRGGLLEAAGPHQPIGYTQQHSQGIQIPIPHEHNTVDQ